jgi:hypothetical protein
MVLQFEQAVETSDCRRLIWTYERVSPVVRDYSRYPVVYWLDMADPSPAGEILPRLARECLRKAAAHLPTRRPFYPETVILAMIGPGGRHPLHADNCMQNDESLWVPNHTPQRALSAIYYLNDDFEGGEIVFERQGLVIRHSTVTRAACRLSKRPAPPP